MAQPAMSRYRFYGVSTERPTTSDIGHCASSRSWSDRNAQHLACRLSASDTACPSMSRLNDSRAGKNTPSVARVGLQTAPVLSCSLTPRPSLEKTPAPSLLTTSAPYGVAWPRGQNVLTGADVPRSTAGRCDIYANLKPRLDNHGLGLFETLHPPDFSSSRLS